MSLADLLTHKVSNTNFETLGMIEKLWCHKVTNWEKHQNIEGPEKIRARTG